MSLDSEPLFVTEKSVKEAGLPYIKEVAERAGMSDREIILELNLLGHKPTHDPKVDGAAFLKVMIDSYKRELFVYASTEKLDLRSLLNVKVKLSWANVFNTNHKSHQDISVARKTAQEAGYTMYCWNGRVYKTDTENPIEDLGTLEELGL